MDCAGNSLLRMARFAALASVAATLLAGCGDKTPAEAAKSQIAAHIGGEVITVPEIEHEFRLANVPAERRRDPETLRRILRDLAARKYLASRAKDAKLDREPTVLMDMLRARDQVLANALLARDINARVSGLSPAEVERYVAGNPHKFANRILIAADQIVLQSGANIQAIMDETRDMKSLDDIAARLAGLGIAFNRGAGTISSSDLPADMYNAVIAKRPGDVFFLRNEPNALFFQVRETQPRPLQGDAAANAARQIIRSDLSRAQLNMVLFNAMTDAKFEGEYAKIMEQGGTSR